MLLDFLVFENTKMSCCNTKIVENQLTQAKLFYNGKENQGVAYKKENVVRALKKSRSGII